MRNAMPRIMSVALIGLCVASLYAFQAAPARAQQQFRCVAADATGQQTGNRLAGRPATSSCCTGSFCHSFVRIVRKQADAAGWTTVIGRMRVRTPEFGDEEIAIFRGYLVANRPGLSPPGRKKQ